MNSYPWHLARLLFGLAILSMVAAPLVHGQSIGSIAEQHKLDASRPVTAWLGVTVRPVDESLARALELPSAEGALVSEVAEGGPASSSGIAPGDVILQFDRWLVRTKDDLVRFLQEKDPGDLVQLRIISRGTERVVQGVQLGGKTPDEPSPELQSTTSATIHPYDLVKNSFRFENQRLTLEVTSVPLLQAGAPWTYRRSNQLWRGLRFTKMLSATEALYEITGLADGMTLQVIGRLLVVMPPRTREGEAVLGPLDLDRDWEIATRGTTDLVNGLGGIVNVPKIEFGRYRGEATVQPRENDSSRSQDEAAPQDLTLRSYDLLRNPFAYKGQTIYLDVASWPSFVDGSLMHYNKWHPGIGLVGTQFSRMLSRDEALYKIMGMQSGAPALHQIGELIVECSGVADRPMTALGPLDLQWDWKVVPMGARTVTNALGSQIEVPVVRYLGTSKR